MKFSGMMFCLLGMVGVMQGASRDELVKTVQDQRPEATWHREFVGVTALQPRHAVPQNPYRISVRAGATSPRDVPSVPAHQQGAARFDNNHQVRVAKGREAGFATRHQAMKEKVKQEYASRFDAYEQKFIQSAQTITQRDEAIEVFMQRNAQLSSDCAALEKQNKALAELAKAHESRYNALVRTNAQREKRRAAIDQQHNRQLTEAFLRTDAAEQYAKRLAEQSNELIRQLTQMRIADQERVAMVVSPASPSQGQA